MRTGIEKLLEWWNKEYVGDGKTTPELALINKARELAAEEAKEDNDDLTAAYMKGLADGKEKPVAPAVLVEAKENIERAMRGITERQTQEDSYWRGYYNCLEETWDSLNVQISRYRPTPDKAEEPLAVLCARKGVKFIHISDENIGIFFTDIRGRKLLNTNDFEYFTAEAKAREYLNGLPDKADKGGK